MPLHGIPKRLSIISYAGEYWLKQGQRVKASADFQEALVLAQAEWEASAWEYREQAVIDRAERGLRMANGG
jgi:hypothetical protein